MWNVSEQTFKHGPFWTIEAWMNAVLEYMAQRWSRWSLFIFCVWLSEVLSYSRHYYYIIIIMVTLLWQSANKWQHDNVVICWHWNNSHNNSHNFYNNNNNYCYYYHSSCCLLFLPLFKRAQTVQVFCCESKWHMQWHRWVMLGCQLLFTCYVFTLLCFLVNTRSLSEQKMYAGSTFFFQDN